MLHEPTRQRLGYATSAEAAAFDASQLPYDISNGMILASEMPIQEPSVSPGEPQGAGRTMPLRCHIFLHVRNYVAAGLVDNGNAAR